MRNKTLLAVCLLTVMATACGSSEKQEVVEQIVVRDPGDPAPPPADTVAAPEGDLVARGEDAFQVCTGCHSVEAGAPSGAGPNLHGVVGRQAGSLEGYPFSEALAASGLTWDEAGLDRFLADPDAAVPGSEMTVGTVADADTRAAIIAYLAATGE